MSVEKTYIDKAVAGTVEHIHRVVTSPSDVYNVAVGTLLSVLNMYSRAITPEDAERLASWATIKIDLDTPALQPVNAATHVDNLVKALLDTLENGDAGLAAEAHDKLSQYVIHNNARTTGLLVDHEADTERFSIDIRGPRIDLTSSVLALVEKLRNANFFVDDRAWKQLVCFIPGYRALKKAKKKLEKLKKLIE